MSGVGRHTRRAVTRKKSTETPDGNGRARAYRYYDAQIISAWKGDVGFGNALNLAVETKQTGPLVSYVASNKPLSRRERGQLATFIKQLSKDTAATQKRAGRPRRDPQKVNSAEKAERNAANLVAQMQGAWREKTRRERVPSVVTNKMIGEAIREASKAFNVPRTKIDEQNIRNALKSGRFVVR